MSMFRTVSYDFQADIHEPVQFKMARRGQRPRRILELEAFVVRNVQPTGVELGNGAYGAVEEVRIPGAICAAKKMHEILLKSATPQEVYINNISNGWVCVYVSVLKIPPLFCTSLRAVKVKWAYKHIKIS